jgi:hypothetical protein
VRQPASIARSRLHKTPGTQELWEQLVIKSVEAWSSDAGAADPPMACLDAAAGLGQVISVRLGSGHRLGRLSIIIS